MQRERGAGGQQVEKKVGALAWAPIGLKHKPGSCTKQVFYLDGGVGSLNHEGPEPLRGVRLAAVPALRA